MADQNALPILRAEDVKIHFPAYSCSLAQKKISYTKAVDGVNLEINAGETLGLVGESGCGKSTLARALLHLVPLTSGSIFYNGIDISKMRHRKLRALRKEFQIVFQDPYASLNPRMTVRAILAEPLLEHNIVQKSNLQHELERLMSIVGLSAKMFNKFPHEFSGGQRQRIALARALSLKPKILVADEPVSALDISVQAQILNLISTLQKQMELSLIFISHNMSVVRHICSKVAVMYSGKIVEMATTKDIFDNPRHPYTKTLLKSIPIPDPILRKQ
ncbi:MAG TPA: peptide ABC transporter substrate-binding protein [Lentisphaeria bacterium]|nr:MAG: hypothetical protein A2X47_02635 [Lentisphaerae bacterium GWF2_38_69]HBM17009.1 peptide ABC transporter substrate-binding protein [Lentisphaeria bacterium]